jgi:hypothetical protein
VGCSLVGDNHLLSARSCRFPLQGYGVEVREETRVGDPVPALYLALTALDAARSPYAIAGFRQGSVFRISLQERRRSRSGVSTVWGTASAPAWEAPELTLSEGRPVPAAEERRAGILLEQASALAYAGGLWRVAREHPVGPIALKLP